MADDSYILVSVPTSPLLQSILFVLGPIQQGTDLDRCDQGWIGSV